MNLFPDAPATIVLPSQRAMHSPFDARTHMLSIPLSFFDETILIFCHVLYAVGTPNPHMQIPGQLQHNALFVTHLSLFTLFLNPDNFVFNFVAVTCTLHYTSQVRWHNPDRQIDFTSSPLPRIHTAHCYYYFCVSSSKPAVSVDTFSLSFV
jgi:hypothetical protein